MKIVFVNTQLSTGGIATSLINLCEQLKDYPEIDIDIVLLNPDNADSRYRLPKNVNIKVHNNRYFKLYKMPFRDVIKNKNIIMISSTFFIKVIGKIIGSEKFMQLIMRNMEVLNGYDVAISFRNDEYQHKPYSIFGCNDFVLNCIAANKKIAWIHNDPDRHGFNYEIAKDKFRGFDNIINVSNGCKNRFDEIIPEYKYKSKLVYNTFNYQDIIDKSIEFNPYQDIDDNIVKFVTVSRIANEQKRIDRIIKVCEKLRNKDICNYIWYIVGDGPDAIELKKMVKKLNLSDKIVFLGKQSNPFPYIKYADCLVMTSEYEAFPMTPNESIIVGTPVITTNHISAKEIINDGKNGFIVDNNYESILKKIEYILKEPTILEDLNLYIKNKEIDRKLALNQFLEVIGFVTNK